MKMIPDTSMKIVIWMSVIIVLAGLATPGESGSAEEGLFPYPHENHVLANGFKIIMIPMKGSGLVAYFVRNLFDVTIIRLITSSVAFGTIGVLLLVIVNKRGIARIF